MSSMSYIHILERYHDHRGAIADLLASLLTGVAEQRALDNPELLERGVNALVDHYPFIDMVFTLDADGVQTSENIVNQRKTLSHSGLGSDRSQRPYFRLARGSDEVVVTAPYLSSTGHNLCLSAALEWRDHSGAVRGYLVLDADMAEIVAFLLGDSRRRRFQPFFKTIYTLIVAGLLTVVGVLLLFSFLELTALLPGEGPPADAKTTHLKPFGVIIFLTLSLAIFDLAKTILEEEVLTHKDIFRHSSTRRTITRFIAAILIAVSIESLLLMFKSALGEGAGILPAVAMMLTVVGLLLGLGVYVYLGSRAEVHLMSWQKQQQEEFRSPGPAHPVPGAPMAREPRAPAPEPARVD
ncbi:PDC sensor domain-containing protein [Thiohalorhabdus sp. Cl-TMA]|uniref:PDC sensor domain-containing protein n=1 Tax=Thiohalorhabdus methylotrophus TaxID=3242694 RepID=A0ABV4TX72_9GAMM